MQFSSALHEVQLRTGDLEVYVEYWQLPVPDFAYGLVDAELVFVLPTLVVGVQTAQGVDVVVVVVV